MSLPRITVVSALWRRPDLARLTLGRFARLQEQFSSLSLVIAGSEGRASRHLALDYGWDYIEVPNSPLGAKWNSTIERSRKHNPDYILVVGSDDWLDATSLSSCVASLEQGWALFGVRDLNFLDLRTGSATHWPGYSGPREGEPIGLGRCVSMQLLRAMRFELWDPLAERGLDGTAWSRIKGRTRRKERQVLTMEENGYFPLAMKSSYSLTDVESIRGTHAEADALLAKYPTDEVDRLNHLMSSMRESAPEGRPSCAGPRR